ncbi:hypothetical protein [Gimesia aquarii]|uniref:hypothetical protein n=1 Tax=Gimesia aquarii TaxID=2527964 RepID=UPI00119E0CFA|nr:hypothetical protein [Gimesia aquarii]
MRNHDIPHDELQWRDNGNGTGSWEIYVRCDLIGSVKVDIPSRHSDGLTRTQEKCLQLVRDLTPKMKPALTECLRKYAIAYLSADLDEDELSFVSEYASVPYLEHTDTPYVFLYADSPVDDEHGVCFLIRDRDVLCCCHGDESLQFNGWDNTAALDELAEDVT